MTQPLPPLSRPAKPPLRLPEFVALFSLTTSLTALSIDAMLPALREIGTALAVSEPNDTQLLVTLFILGMVFFSFAIYVRVLAHAEWATVLAPLGGLTYFAGWLCLAFGAWRGKGAAG